MDIGWPLFQVGKFSCTSARPTRWPSRVTKPLSTSVLRLAQHDNSGDENDSPPAEGAASYPTVESTSVALGKTIDRLGPSATGVAGEMGAAEGGRSKPAPLQAERQA